jgi:hypothetical protein
MLLNIVTDEELLASEVVKTILLILIGVSIVYNLIRLIRSGTKSRKMINLIILLFLFLLFFFVGKEYIVEGAMLRNPQYVKGTTIGYCSVFALGKGIEFEYEINGKKFRNCNTFYPVTKDSIKVPGGEYRVRFAQKFPDNGRMDFQKPQR